MPSPCCSNCAIADIESITPWRRRKWRGNFDWPSKAGRGLPSSSATNGPRWESKISKLANSGRSHTKNCLRMSLPSRLCHPESGSCRIERAHDTFKLAQRDSSTSLGMTEQMYRTHHCNELRKADIGREVKLAGWVAVRRDHGGVIFIDLRDREGLTQVVFRPEENAEVAKQAHSLRTEDVIQVCGKVAPRLVGTENPKLATGDIEVLQQLLTILNRAENLPFQIDAELSNEDLELTYRYFDLRRPRLSRNLQTRHRVTQATRQYLDSQGFIEIETPILSKSTPEGARDFLVPSRLLPGKFYALPQAPQQYKQLLMVAGMEKYFQIAKAFRDEDLRADRQPEFTQIDIEASFVTPNDIYTLTEGMLAAIFKAEKESLRTKLHIEEGDCIFFAAGKWEIACEVLGRIRLRIAEIQGLTSVKRQSGSDNRPSGSDLDCLWVTDFLLMQWSAEENKWNAVHHPFTRPKAEDLPLLEQKKFGEMRADAYDIVLNGVEIGGGSIRIHEPELQAKMFEALGVSAEEQQAKFGHLLRAFRLGAPPHGGIALGLDRLVMLICGEESIRDVMAFPKNNRGQELMTQSPAEVDAKQLRELSITLAKQKL